jgi:two-component system cell cycle sensor histidine kinase/response regulator CckA
VLRYRRVSSVLVVDDEADILKLVETVLTRGGHKVVTASNGERAIEKARKMTSAPDLLLTDVVMPGLSGPMIADQLREHYPDMKVLFMSAFEDRQVVRRYVKGEGFELLAKPFQIEELAAKVKAMLPDGNKPVGVTHS